MNGESRVTMSRSAVVLTAVALLIAGAGMTYLLMRAGADRGGQMANMDARSGPSIKEPTGASSPAGNAPLPDVIVRLTEEAVQRAGIVVAPVSSERAATALRLPGLVEPDAYRQVVVTPLVAGRVTRILAELGDQVRQGQTLAHIYSPELADAQTRYIAARAQLEAHDRELQRTQKLVEIGAASRQELERIHAEHTAQTAEVESARSRLELLGIPASALDNLALGKGVSATTSVPAPITGVVTERLANVGLNVDPSAKLFTIVDLSTVWMVADLYEKDFSRVRIGSRATITTTAYPDLALEGRVSYIDPQIRPDTRTAKVRVAVANPRNQLRLGMYADVLVAGDDGAAVLVIPRSAVQNIGDHAVVYLANPKEPGTFTEREVRLGEPRGEQVELLSGVQPGDLVVTAGGFFVRAERERLGLRAPAAGVPGPSEAREAGANVQTATIVLTAQGYEPAKVNVRAGLPVRITFLRTTDKTCGTEVVFPSLNITRALPLNERVTIEFTSAKSGDLAFACGMNMLHGAVVVQ
ncbi:MAG: efflux RND transporter periplasmic adaptor subunit [Vicinamibacterales bacterium]